MLVGIHGTCPACSTDRAYFSRRDWHDEHAPFECRSCGADVPEGAWHAEPRNKVDLPMAFISSDRSNNYHCERRVLGLPQGHPDLIASSEKDAMRICEKNGIDYHTQQFLNSEAKEAAVAKARVGNVRSGKIRRSQPSLKKG